MFKATTMTVSYRIYIHNTQRNRMYDNDSKENKRGNGDILLQGFCLYMKYYNIVGSQCVLS